MTGPSVKDIAIRAGVSTATVSRILNGKIGHRTDTILRVKSVVAMLNEEKRSKQPNVLVPDGIGVVFYAHPKLLNDSYLTNLTDAILQTARAYGYVILLISVSQENCHPNYIYDMVNYYHLKGIVIPNVCHLQSLIPKLNDLPVPAVTINAVDNYKLPNIYSDVGKRGEDAAQYLWSKGHRNVAIGALTRIDGNHSIMVKQFRNTFRQLDPQVKIRLWDYKDTTEHEPMLAAINEIQSAADPPTAVFFTNCELTRAFYLALHQCGIRVPEDISLLATEEDGELTCFEISAFVEPVRQMGEAAVKMLLRQRHYPENISNEHFICALKSRNSVQNLNQLQSRVL